jgi:uracil-DNA glycosylase family 4
LERKTLPEKEASAVWDELAGFGSYGFNKSHAVEYSLISYWDAWLKAHYPAEFIACSLTYGAEDKEEALVEEARRMGLKIVLPRVGVSAVETWEAYGDRPDRIYAPLTSIKGLGAKTIDRFLKGKGKAFFSGNLSDADALGTAVGKTLRDVGALRNKDRSDNTEDAAVQARFNFCISNDPAFRIRPVVQVLTERGALKLATESDLARRGSRVVMFGKISDLRYGYRKNVKDGVAGTVDNMGSVYGFFRCGDSAPMVVFDGRLYSERKADVERCQGEWMVLEGTTSKSASASISSMANEADLLACRLNFRHGQVLQPVDAGCVPDPAGCDACPLRAQAQRPVCAQVCPGRALNAMVFGEAPGRHEDGAGLPFHGPSGRDLFGPLAELGVPRTSLVISNTVKCWPSIDKTPNDECAAECFARWGEKEIAAVKPAIILAVGAKAVRALLGEDARVTTANATTQWSRRWLCWVTVVIHPAAVMRNPALAGDFKSGVQEFARAFKNLTAVSGESKRIIRRRETA